MAAIGDTLGAALGTRDPVLLVYLLVESRGGPRGTGDPVRLVCVGIGRREGPRGTGDPAWLVWGVGRRGRSQTRTRASRGIETDWPQRPGSLLGGLLSCGGCM